MRHTEFTCDICGDVVGKGRATGRERPFLSFQLGLIGDHHKAADRFVLKAPEEAEKHFCLLCLDGLISMATRIAK